MKGGLVLIAISVCCVTTARSDPFGPWSVDPRHPAIEIVSPSPAKLHTPAQFGSSPFGLAFLIYSRLITKIDGPRCSHRPTCASYAYRALVRHKIPLGAWMALARLMRGAFSSAIRPLVTLSSPSGIYFLDTLADGAFWLPGYSPMSGLKR